MNDAEQTTNERTRGRRYWWRSGLCLLALTGLTLSLTLHSYILGVTASQLIPATNAGWRTEVRQFIAMTHYLLTPEPEEAVLGAVALDESGALPAIEAASATAQLY